MMISEIISIVAISEMITFGNLATISSSHSFDNRTLILYGHMRNFPVF